MDFTLRCNILKCRAQLDDRAVVTTCSHIFCVPCSESSRLASPDTNARTCPACGTQLSSPDDAVVTQLNPTEDYKTSVLSGLSPTIVMECAGRALSFFSYQTAQEMQVAPSSPGDVTYQEFLARSLTDKYSTLSSQMDKIIHDANSEITGLRDRLDSMHVEQKTLEQKNHDLVEKYKEKSKQQQQTHRLYTQIKTHQLAAGLEIAADRDADHVLQDAGQPHYAHASVQRHQHMQSRGSNVSGGSGGRSRTIQAWEQQQHVATSVNGRVMQSSRSAPVHVVPATPSGHRQHLPAYGSMGTAMKQGAMGNVDMRQGSVYRPPLNSLDPNSYGHGGSRMSAGVRVGRPSNGPLQRTDVPISRPPGFGMHAR
ncbi:hypothetical protein LTR53_009078 [Teratosphaeriaceae sp. CCFEE 6253]|nr:hypothetical protein LTR53_009078 [Teratosphaeriaceae sp. CCFEE 6253]